MKTWILIKVCERCGIFEVPSIWEVIEKIKREWLLLFYEQFYTEIFQSRTWTSVSKWKNIKNKKESILSVYGFGIDFKYNKSNSGYYRNQAIHLIY